MSDFSDNTDWEYVKLRLKLACSGQAVELQLVWMFEILSIILFQKNTTASLVTRLESAYRLNHKHMSSLADSVGLSRQLVGRLSKYRDTFVHNGYLESQQLLQKILCDTASDELDALMQLTGVTLNMKKTLM